MGEIRELLELLPEDIQKVFLYESGNSKIQEIRIKINKNLIYLKDNEEYLSEYICSKRDLDYIIKRLSNYSLYAFEEELKQGYITINGGHRIGFCGVCVMENSKIKTIKQIGSINIRVCKEILGCSDKILKYLLKENEIYNTIIISPPKCGKTTLIRDLGRNISNGVKCYGLTGKNVSIIDERSEIAACYKGVPQMNVGIRTDVLDNCPKSYGIMMCIRSMAPQVIVCDEIGTYEDVNSVLMALNSGVNIITSIHGNNIEDLYKRRVFNELINNNVFKRAVILDNKYKIGHVSYIYDFTKKQYMEVQL